MWIDVRRTSPALLIPCSAASRTTPATFADASVPRVHGTHTCLTTQTGICVTEMRPDCKFSSSLDAQCKQTHTSDNFVSFSPPSRLKIRCHQLLKCCSKKRLHAVVECTNKNITSFSNRGSSLNPGDSPHARASWRNAVLD